MRWMSELQDERWKAHAREHRLRDEALKLQASEYERRLQALNHAHEKAQEDRMEFGRKEDILALARKVEESTDVRIHAVDEHFGRVEDTLDGLMKFKSQAQIMAPLLVIVGSIVGALITKALIG